MVLAPHAQDAESHDRIDRAAVVRAPTEDALRSLLADYANVVRAGERTPTVVWIRTRPPGTSPWARWWRLPRPSFGLTWLVVRHVTRSVDALSRAYARRAALGELDAAGLRERQSVADFRASLPGVPWKTLLAASTVVGLLVARALVGVLGDLAAYALYGLSGSLAPAQAAELADQLERVMRLLASVSLGGAVEVLFDWDGVGPRDLLVLGVLLLLAAYAVGRPLSTVFRLKRMLFNLADDPDADLRRTTSTWHVGRSTGLYVRERAVLGDAGCAPTRETPVDLIVSILGAVLVGALLVRVATFAGPAGLLRSDVALVAVEALVLGTRIAWLATTARHRATGAARPSGAAGGQALPQVLVLPATARVVDRRGPVEAAALASVSYLAVPLVYRLWHQLGDVGREARASRLRPAPVLPAWVVPALAASCALVVPGLVAGVLIWRGVAVRAVGVLTAVVASVAAVLGAWFWWLSLVNPLGSEEAYLGAILGLVPTAFVAGLAQHAVNTAVTAAGRRWERPVPPDRLTSEFRVPPTWPRPPRGWQPPPGFRPDPSWPPPPDGWAFWQLRER